MEFVRVAGPQDAAALRDIYAHYVDSTTATFECVPPTVQEFSQHITQTLKGHPFLVCGQGDEVLGYAYASQYSPRGAYIWSVSLSVYIRSDCRRRGLGAMLYRCLFEILRLQQCHRVYAVVTAPNEVSVKFHQRMGLLVVGHLDKAGYKLGQWLSADLLEGQLLPCKTPPKPFVPFAQLSPEVVNDAINRGKQGEQDGL